MFIGHFAVGFASKKFAPRTNLGILMAAPLWLDILWPFFLLLGWEHVRIDPGNTRFTPLDLYDYPWSHSLLMSIVWATLFAGIYYAISRYRTGAIVVWIGVVSHWVLDWITHRPDMPLYPGSPRYGLGLWNSISGTLVIELSMFAIGIWLYVETTRPRDWIGRYAFGATSCSCWPLTSAIASARRPATSWATSPSPPPSLSRFFSCGPGGSTATVSYVRNRRSG
jgi:membrane-bound metal-dependent hydrolase YbcI (DUF457 family)